MVRLIPMTEKEFDAFMELSMKDQAQGQVQAGVWRAEEAAANIKRLRGQFLPTGLTTPNHYFFTIEETSVLMHSMRARKWEAPSFDYDYELRLRFSKETAVLPHSMQARKRRPAGCWRSQGFSKEASAGAKVGALWYTVVEEEGQRQVFVMDIQIYEAYRRQGYGSQAFKIMEEKAQEMGISTIALHVFEHNRAARAMYEKLGYVGTGSMMSKEIG